MRRLLVTLSLISLAGLATAQPPLEYVREDPAKISTAEACGECHVSEYEVWKRTTHATGFKTLHRTDSAETIAKRLGVALMKRDSPCLQCHYTSKVQREQLRAISGVSCESCHGAGEDWINIHNDYGGKGLDHTTETPEHRAMRIEQSRAAGMRRPSEIYDAVSSCYACHTVPDEKLVNVGRHAIGSTGFELVEWAGEIRHNFLESFKNGDGTDNAETTAERKRLLYAAGRALELEHALRGVASATEKGVYLKAMQRRVRNALIEVRAIARRAEIPEMQEIVTAVKKSEVRLGNGSTLLRIADSVGDANRRFLDGRDGTLLASLDPLVLGTADAEEDDVFEDDEVVVADADAATAPSDPGTAPGTATAASTTAAPTVVRTEAIPAVGERKSRLRPRSSHDTLEAETCQKCHGDQNAWWFDDAHYAAIDPFLEGDPDNIRIARLYGISPSRMTRGDSLCMDCHGTVATGREKREVADGVSCQSCHGGAKDFLEPHQEGEKSQGLQRPGYVKALGLGMVELKNLETRARTCSGCHFITDPRLISSGHPSGIDFDYAEGMRTIRHWEDPPKAPAAITAAFDSVLAARGPVPKVRLARLATTVAAPGAATAQATAQVEGTDGGRVFRPRTPRARPAASRAVTTPGEAQTLPSLPPFPEVDDSTPIEDILGMLKERLEQLYRAVRGEP